MKLLLAINVLLVAFVLTNCSVIERALSNDAAEQRGISVSFDPDVSRALTSGAVSAGSSCSCCGWSVSCGTKSGAQMLMDTVSSPAAAAAAAARAAGDSCSCCGVTIKC